MNAVVLLADSAQTDSTQKVHALGLGWSVTGTPTPPAALVVLLKVPWSETGVAHLLALTLVDADGRAVTAGRDPQTGEPTPVRITAQFEVGRPEGLPPGMPVDQAFTVNLGPGMALQPGMTYEWRLEIDGRHEASWSASFHVRS